MVKSGEATVYTVASRFLFYLNWDLPYSRIYKMERIAFKMKLHPGCELEYKERHDKIWPELRSALNDVGIHDYSIFFDKETYILFGVFKVSDKALADTLPTTKVMQDWWAYMSDLMDVNADKSPVSKTLEEVFYLL